MATSHERISDQMADWIGRQHMFFVSTAPLGGDGHVNVSPKGLDSLHIEGPTTVSYLDLTGSGVETISHLRENGRITIMLCALEGPARIVRLYGRGEVIEKGSPGFAEAAAPFPPRHGARAVIRIELDRVSDSCGYEFVEQRSRLLKWADNRTEDELVEYRATKNSSSIDGLPGFMEPAGVE